MNRISVPVLASFALLLVACPKKAPDVMDAGVATATPVPETAAVDAAVAPATTLAPAKPTTTVKHDAGAGDAGAATDAGAVTAAADAGKAPEHCCCKVGTKYSHSGQSECTTTMKGACVAKTECEARECCCDAGGKKATAFQSECTTSMKGKCVSKDQCK